MNVVAYSSVSDAQLVARCRQGDQDAWRELVSRFSRYVYAIAVQGFRLPEHEADDVFQEVFARVYEHLADLRSDEAIRPWIGQLARRLCINRLRTKGTEELSDESASLAEDEDVFGRLDDALVVHEALAKLTDPCREVLDRFFARDESYRTIGEALGIPAGTIASRISRCLAKLRDELAGRNLPSRESGGSVSE